MDDGISVLRARLYAGCVVILVLGLLGAGAIYLAAGDETGKGKNPGES